MKDNIVFGFLDTLYNRPLHRKGKPDKRKEKWHSTAYLFQNASHFEVSAYHLIYQKADAAALKEAITDIRALSPKTKIQTIELAFKNADDLSNVYVNLSQYFNGFKFKVESKRYYFYLTSGSPAQQLVANRLALNKIFPGSLVHSTPTRSDHKDVSNLQFIDPDWYTSEKLIAKFNPQFKSTNSYLKAGIDTKDCAYNELVSRIETVAIQATAPLLFTGPEGSGKSGLVQRLYELKCQQGLLTGKLIRFDCAVQNEEEASASLVGYSKDLTDANLLKKGLFARAQKGILFLDSINELEPQKQAILLAAIESMRFQTIGSPTESKLEFQLIAGTRVDLRRLVKEGKFREDLFARLSLWTFHLPALRNRIDDFEANLDFELNLIEQHQVKRIRFRTEARDFYLKFAKQPTSSWAGNFRDLSASVARMATLANSGWIDLENVAAEVATLKHQWGEIDYPLTRDAAVNLADFLSKEVLTSIDNFDIPQLKYTIWVCQQSRSAADAGRQLFNHSRTQKRSSNDTSRLTKYLSRFDLQFQDIASEQQA